MFNSIKQYDMAVEYSDYALSVDSLHAKSWVEKAFSYLMLGRSDEGAHLCAQVYGFTKEPFPELYEVWTMCLYEANDTLAFRRVLAEGVKRFPDSYRLLFYCAADYSSRGMFRDEYLCNEKIFSQDANQIYAAYRMGVYNEAYGAFSRALVCYCHVLLTAPESDGSALVLEHLSKWPELTQEIKHFAPIDKKIAKSLNGLKVEDCSYGIHYEVLDRSLKAYTSFYKYFTGPPRPLSFWKVKNPMENCCAPILVSLYLSRHREAFLHSAVYQSGNAENDRWTSEHQEAMLRYVQYLEKKMKYFNKKEK